MNFFLDFTVTKKHNEHSLGSSQKPSIVRCITMSLVQRKINTETVKNPEISEGDLKNSDYWSISSLSFSS